MVEKIGTVLSVIVLVVAIWFGFAIKAAESGGTMIGVIIIATLAIIALIQLVTGVYD